MTYLLSISIGPVQPFIEAARRTADLYAGSQLLADIAKAVAKQVKASGGGLIFPADPQKDGPNKILATVSGDVSAIAESARHAAQEILEQAWASTASSVGERYIRLELATDQIAHFLEFYAAWVPINGNYADARKEVESLLAGRKALRDFEQPRSQSGLPKSPLDPSRDTVLVDKTPRGVAPLYLKEAEHLDAVSLIKRVRGRGIGSVKSTTQLAATLLVERLRSTKPTEMQALEAIAENAGSGVTIEDLLYPGRREDAVKAGELSSDDAQQAKQQAEQALGSKEPPDWASYYAILCADGDRMGKLLSTMTAPAQHVEFSRKLTAFAAEAKQLVLNRQGCLVYSGGDDVLALLPTHTALECAATLAGSFASGVGGTLSVGVAIVHHMDPLRISLERARAAEREAKKQRNALAVALYTRGGEPRVVAEPWSANHDLTTWREWTVAFRDKGGLSHGFPYELRHLAREALEAMPPSVGTRQMAISDKTLVAEALRILERKEGGTTGAHVPLLVAAIERCKTPDDLEHLVAKLIICRFLAQYPLEVTQ